MLKYTEFPISKQEMIGLRDLLKISEKSMKKLVNFVKKQVFSKTGIKLSLEIILVE